MQCCFWYFWLSCFTSLAVVVQSKGCQLLQSHLHLHAQFVKVSQCCCRRGWVHCPRKRTPWTTSGLQWSRLGRPPKCFGLSRIPGPALNLSENCSQTQNMTCRLTLTVWLWLWMQFKLHAKFTKLRRTLHAAHKIAMTRLRLTVWFRPELQISRLQHRTQDAWAIQIKNAQQNSELPRLPSCPKCP